MKKLKISLFLLAVIVLVTSCGGDKAKSSDENNDKTNFDNIVVTYESTIDMMGVKTTTNETFWQDEANQRKATHTTTVTQMLGKTEKQETLAIEDKDWSYNIDLLSKTGTKGNMKEMKEMATAMAAAFATNIDLKNLKTLKDFVEKNGGKMLPNETILGKECTVYEMMGIKSWLYKGVILKAMMGDKLMKNAVKVEENVDIPESIFEVPKGITITEAPAME
jgi:hypothetical protein